MANSDVLDFTSVTIEEVESWQHGEDYDVNQFVEMGLPDNLKWEVIEIKDAERMEILRLWEGVPDEVEVSFCRTYGRIKDLLGIKAQKKMIFALLKYWNPAFGVFTFSDMDLTPTLEEYSEMLELPISSGSQLYAKCPKESPIGKMAQILGVHPSEASKHLSEQGQVKGWMTPYIMSILRIARSEEQWERFSRVSALLIYGLILFPSTTSRVDTLSVDLFGEVYSQNINPILALLAETFLSLNECRRGKQKHFRGSFILLYVWMCFHVVEDLMREFYCWRNDYNPRPLARFERLRVPEQTGQQWQQLFTNLNSARVNWRAPWLKTETFIFGCGEFQNVPLIGIRGYTTHSPLLVMRQYRYRQCIPLTAAVKKMESIYCGQADYQVMLHRFTAAWKNPMVIKDMETTVRKNEVATGYLSWFQSRRKAIAKETTFRTPYSAKQLMDYEYEDTVQKRRIAELEKELEIAKKEKEQAEIREQHWLRMCQTLKPGIGQKRKRQGESSSSDSINENEVMRRELLRVQEQVKQLKQLMGAQKSKVARWERACQKEKRQKEEVGRALDTQREIFERELLDQARVSREELAEKEKGFEAEKRKVKKESAQKQADLELKIQTLWDKIQGVEARLQQEYSLNESQWGTIRKIEDLWKESYVHLKAMRKMIRLIQNAPEPTADDRMYMQILINHCVAFLGYLKMYL